jgi:hypothetical protein
MKLSRTKPKSDRRTVTILSRGEEGDLDHGPVLVLHVGQDESLMSQKTSCHAFGPFPTIRDALEDIHESITVTKDECYKVIIDLANSPRMQVVRPAEFLDMLQAQGVEITMPDSNDDEDTKAPLIN